MNVCRFYEITGAIIGSDKIVDVLSTIHQFGQRYH